MLELQAFDSCRDAVSAYGSFHVFGQRSEKDLGYSQAKHNRRILTLDQANSAQAISTDDIGQASNQPSTKPSSDQARFVDQAGTRQHDKCIHQARQVPTKQDSSTKLTRQHDKCIHQARQVPTKQHRPSKHRPSTINPSSSHEAEAHQATNQDCQGASTLQPQLHGGSKRPCHGGSHLLPEEVFVRAVVQLRLLRGFMWGVY